LYKEKFSLQDKVAIVTGASRGIGRAIAEGFAEMGAKVILASRTAEALEEVKKGIVDAGGEAHVIPTHVARMDQIRSLVQGTVEKYGTVDILVNNAATNPVFCSAAEVEELAFDKIFNLNVKGMFFLTQEVGKILLEKGSGSVINVSSEAGFCPIPFLGVYSISKAAVNMLTKVFAQEWASRGVRVNGIAPGLVRTHFSKYLWENEAIYNAAMAATPLGRIAEPDEMVGLAILLASDASSYITGQVILADGGRDIAGAVG
jgi:NAD(P)-dependent dehydrogenase (short-subunit alcohol dehydrogenase family)